MQLPFGYIKKYKIVMLMLLLFVCAFVSFCNYSQKNTIGFTGIFHPNGKEFAGSETCFKCHKEISDSHLNTAHAFTSAIADINTIKGSFNNGENVLQLNERLKIEMKKEGNNFFEAGFIDGMEAMRQPMDIVIGSGGKGQTYLYWFGNKLFQLPVSYYTPLNSWCSSPGFPGNQIMFNRPIIGRCLECHSTNVKTIDEKDEAGGYDKTQIIYGITCERCHGPAAEHVAFQLANPDEKKAKFIINTALLSRQQKLDNCALCHSGLRENSTPSFSYVTGDKLDDYSTPDYKADSTAKLDVHGNQYGLLTASKCFKMSSMDCSSCHDTHKKQTNDLRLFSQKCMSCHSEDSHNFCTVLTHKSIELKNNCINCHMPALPSAKIFLEVQDKSKSTADLVRTHLIGIYKEKMQQ